MTTFDSFDSTAAMTTTTDAEAGGCQVASLRIGASEEKREWVLLDSGSCLNACPATYAPQVPLEQLHRLRAFAVNGQQSIAHGTKRVELELHGGYKLIVRLVVHDGRHQADRVRGRLEETGLHHQSRR